MPRPTVTVADYLDTLKNLKYLFALNECDDSIEVNGRRLDDVTHSTICARMDAEGFHSADKVKNAYTMAAGLCRYHPIKKWLSELIWDKGEHVKDLANHFTDAYGMFDVWLRKWLIGSIDKAVRGEQNFCLVLDGRQGIGKSNFAHWLAFATPNYPTYFAEEQIQPDNKDSSAMLITKFLWEVSELGATIRRADVEALKAFVSRRVVTIRHPYGRYAAQKSALANFIGTVNNDTGILSDRTGNRRFIISRIENINWAYSDNIDPAQVWAEAHSAWLAGETGILTSVELDRLHEISGDYTIPDSIEDFLQAAYIIDPDDQDRMHWIATADIINKVQNTGFRGTSVMLSMGVASILKQAGLHKCKDATGLTHRNGYLGMQERMP
jgi:predicted P-loop ATPase